MENDLHARVQTLARLRRCRIGVSDRWDSSGGTDRHNYLTSYTAPAALLIPANSASPNQARSSPTVAPAPKMAMRPRAAEQRDELATAAHSITSSARASSVGGTSSPSALAVRKLITSWYWVGCWTGRSAGFSPLRTRST